MIVVKIVGGLGNQMFQYAFGRYLSLKYNTKLKLDLNAYKNYQLHRYSLNKFNIKTELATDVELLVYSKLFRRKEHSIKFNTRSYNFGRISYIDGYWQSQKYFIDIEHIIRQEFTLKEELSDQNQYANNLITSCNSVAVHFRRGDYIKDNNTFKVHGICSYEYYKKAIEIIDQRVKNPHYFIFSDDIDWVKKNIALYGHINYIDWDNSPRNNQELFLISQCKHQIIANSSFSWWGAWLNINPNKIIIAPLKWYNKIDDYYDCSDIIPQDWIKI